MNEEILLFRSLHGEGAILCILAEGGPETSFPPALIEGGREPLAANLGGRKDSFRLGTTQLAASMLGVGLDQLIQRDAKRRRNRFRLLTTASMVFAAVMGGMAWTAIDARDKAETSRSEAENMVEYLITDLKQELDSVGRLSILDDVGIRVTDYYDAIPLSDMDDERLTRQARARHVLGEVAIKQGSLDHALTELTASYKATEEYLRRNPDNPEAIFAHAQSEYWVGKVYLEQKEPNKALPYRLAYSKLSQRLYESDPDNQDYVFEYGWAENNLGLIYNRLKKYTLSTNHYETAISIFKMALTRSPNNKDILFEIASIQRNLSRTQFQNGKIDSAKSNYLAQIKILEGLLSADLNNTKHKDSLLLAKIKLLEIIVTHDKECPITDLMKVIGNSEDLVRLDPTNTEWFRGYVYLQYIAFQHCEQLFDKNWIRAKLTTLDQFMNLFPAQNIDTKKRITWLEEFQAKLNSK